MDSPESSGAADTPGSPPRMSGRPHGNRRRLEVRKHFGNASRSHTRSSLGKMRRDTRTPRGAPRLLLQSQHTIRRPRHGTLWQMGPASSGLAEARKLVVRRRLSGTLLLHLGRSRGSARFESKTSRQESVQSTKHAQRAQKCPKHSPK